MIGKNKRTIIGILILMNLIYPNQKGKKVLQKKERRKTISKLKRMNLMMISSMIRSWTRRMIFNFF